MNAFAGSALIDVRFGRLVAVGVAPDLSGRRAVLCRCDCGNQKIVNTKALTSGNTKSCGCLRDAKIAKLNWKHGLSVNLKKHALYRAWKGIKNRCFNPKNRAFKYYGGRGIGIYSGWKDDPVAFVTWCLDNGWRQDLTIDRFPDANGDYAPDNIRFVENLENAYFRHWGRRCDHEGFMAKALLCLPA